MEVKPGYKQTDVGVIPEEWDVGRLSSLLEQPRSVRYGIVQPGKFALGGCLMLRSQDYSKGWTQPDEMHRVSSELENQYRNARIRRGDLIMTVVGAGIGQVVIAPDWLDGAILSRSTARIAVDESRASREFVKASLESPVGKRQILDCQKEGAQPVVSCQDLAKFFLPCPPPPEQRAIAEALSDVDGLLGGLDRLIAKKRDLKQAAMQQLLTGQTRLPGFRGEWEVQRLGDVVDTDPENLGSDTRRDFRFNYIALEDVDRGFLRSHSEQLFASAPSRARRKLRPDDVLVSTVRPNLQSHLLFKCESGSWVCSTGFCVVRCHEGVTYPGYVFFHLFGGGVNRQIDALLTGSNYPAINSGDVRALQIPFPSHPEQIAIAEVLTEMDEELAGLEQRREKTRALKQAMMQELLTGRTRLP